MTSHSKGREGGVHTSVTIRDKGDERGLSVVTSCRTLCDSQNVMLASGWFVLSVMVIAGMTTLQSTAG